MQFIDTPVGRFPYEYGSTAPKGGVLFDKRCIEDRRVRYPDGKSTTQMAMTGPE
jgi:hypothetical protein